MGKEKQARRPFSRLEVKPSEMPALFSIAETYSNILQRTVTPSAARAEVLGYLSSFSEKCQTFQQYLTQNEQAKDERLPAPFTREEMMTFVTALVYYSHMASAGVAPSPDLLMSQEVLLHATHFYIRYQTLLMKEQWWW